MNIDAGAPSRWLPGDGPGSGDELDRLAELHREGLAVAPIMLVPAEAQENFYRYGNLVQQLSELFLGVDPADPDEDDLEERAPQAMALITGSYLLDEVIDRFYDTVNLLPRSRRVRRPGEEGLLASGNRASLLALKRIWASDWSFASLVSRLEAERSFRLEAAPVLVHASDEPTTDAALLRVVERILGERRTVYVTQDGSISRLE